MFYMNNLARKGLIKITTVSPRYQYVKFHTWALFQCPTTSVS